MNNIIEEKRQHILQNSATATSQRELLDVLDNLLPTIDQLVFKEPLHGDIDFSVLSECGFTNITSIVFESGDVTSIRNLPNQVTRLHIDNNLLTHLEDLPESLADLHAVNNGLQQLDLSKLANLKSVNVANNQLVALLLPTNIETLSCENNRLVELDLNGMNSLKTLNCNGNPLLSINNLQDTIQEFNMENNPALEIRRQMNKDDNNAGIKTNVEVKQAIRHFFELKSQYEENRKDKQTAFYEKEKLKGTSAKKRRELLQGMKMPCVYCDRAVNTLFSCKNRVYKAVCGDDKNPCAFHIEIEAGKYTDVISMVNILKIVNIENERETIIKTKMDTLLNYQNETNAVKQFKHNLEEYNEINDYFKTILLDYEELYFNKETDAKIKRKMTRVFELQEKMRKMLEDYKKTNTEVVLADIMLFYMQELLPEYKNLQELKYPFKEIEIKGTEDQPIYVVVQKPMESRRMDYEFGEREPQVIVYNV